MFVAARSLAGLINKAHLIAPLISGSIEFNFLARDTSPLISKFIVLFSGCNQRGFSLEANVVVPKMAKAPKNAIL